MDFIDAIIFGVVEGVTEFLPISSTGHLIFTASLLRLPQTEFLKSFEIAIQLGAIAAVVVLYWRRLITDRKTCMRVGAAFIPTALAGFFLYPLVKGVLLESASLVAWMLIVGGVVLIVFEYLHTEKAERHEDIGALSYRQAAYIGVFQAIAMVPGVSRAAATIIGGLVVGLSRKATVEFSFLLAVPTMLAATGFDLLKSANSFSSNQFGVLGVGFFVSFIVAMASIVFLLRFIQAHTFISFGIYRVVAGVFFLLVVL